jgi:NTP pyrophosphatase (non-canonical NTP hydrolase)
MASGKVLPRKLLSLPPKVAQLNRWIAAAPPEAEMKGTTMNFSDYQHSASETSQLELAGPDSAIAAMLGIASETGQILNVWKKYLRDGADFPANREFLKVELGDLLWYVSAVATALQLDLEEIAIANLERTHDRYLPRQAQNHSSPMPPLDAMFPIHERFPRRLVVKFVDQSAESGQSVASLRLISAEPNAFPNGPVTIGGKLCGFKVGEALGAKLTDNSRQVDDYRFHDAIHFAFMALLGWSPTMRTLLNLKRRSNAQTDEAEDGARAIYAEEGMSAILARLAELRNGFQREGSVDGDAIVVVKSATVGLEVARLPVWLWRKAISQAFVAMKLLAENGGGFLTADLDQRSLLYTKTRP